MGISERLFLALRISDNNETSWTDLKVLRDREIQKFCN